MKVAKAKERFSHNAVTRKIVHPNKPKVVRNVTTENENGKVKQVFVDYEDEKIDRRLKFRDFDIENSIANNFNMGQMDIKMQPSLNDIDRMAAELPEIEGKLTEMKFRMQQFKKEQSKDNYNNNEKETKNVSSTNNI